MSRFGEQQERDRREGETGEGDRKKGSRKSHLPRLFLALALDETELVLVQNRKMVWVNEERSFVTDEDINVSSKLGRLENLDMFCTNHPGEKKAYGSVRVKSEDAQRTVCDDGRETTLLY